MLASKRCDATLIMGRDGGLAGIMTDVDVTRRVVAQQLDVGGTRVEEVMTRSPTCVTMTDSAMSALSIMVDNHFRHLPVLNDQGAIVGLLDIAKCLNDAISKLEKSHSKTSNAAELALKEMASLQGAGSQSQALQSLLGPLLNQAFGNSGSSPTLGSILDHAATTIVSPEDRVLEVGLKMTESRKAALVVDYTNGSGELVGIFGFKDMMCRVVAKELSLEGTPVESVMTPSPESVSPEMTVLEALQIMHEHKFLTLPVCNQTTGAVLGIVDVMDLILSCDGPDGTGGLQNLFDSAFDIPDDASESGSIASRDSRASRNSRMSGVGGRSIVSSSHTARTHNHRNTSTFAGANREPMLALTESDERPVSKLRPKKPNIASVDDSILKVTQMLSLKRSDAALIMGRDGGLAGIMTDVDITRRVVAQRLDASSAIVEMVMTPNPTCVTMSDSAMSALSIMVDNHFRHLPVLNDLGAIVGLLDIAKCLNDAISKLERSQDKSSNAAELALKKMANLQGADGSQAEALQSLLGPLMNKAFGGNTSATLASILTNRPATIVAPDSNILEVGLIMAEARKAALVVDHDGELVGIFGFKDMMCRVVAKELPLEETNVASVMTPSPESVTPETTVLEALQLMHDHGFLTLPVCTDEVVVGVVDVMDLILSYGGADVWKSLFDSTFSISDDESERGSIVSNNNYFRQQAPILSHPTPAPLKADPSLLVAGDVPRTINTTNEVESDLDSKDDVSLSDTLQKSIMDASMSSPSAPVFSSGIVEASSNNNSNNNTTPNVAETFTFRVVDSKGNNHSIRCKAKFDALQENISNSFGVGISILELKYIDEEGDALLITSDGCLEDGIAEAKKYGNSSLKIVASSSGKAQGDNTTLIIGGALAGALVLFSVVLIAAKPRR